MTRVQPFTRSALLALTTLLPAAPLLAQSNAVSVPRESQRALVGQTLGVTDVTVRYHRPLVKGRKVWGGIVPYGEVWRAGANENTVFEVTDDVTIEGQPLPRGAYGLHMIPTADAWTVIFSKNHTSWGSYFYDKAEDALRVTVKPVAAESREALTYEIVDVTPDSAVVTLRWEKLAVPFRVQANVKESALAAMRRDLRGLRAFDWMGWNDAAAWCLEQKTNLDEALKWADKSIENEERFENLETKSGLLAALGKPAEAKAMMDKAIAKANAGQLHNYARQLLRDKKTQEALKLFEMNVARNPDVWFVRTGLARGQSATGDFKNAAKSMKEALAKAPADQKPRIEGLVKKLEAGQDIN